MAAACDRSISRASSGPAAPKARLTACEPECTPILALSPGAVLEVPSAVIPEEVNYLLNPQHADAAAITVTSRRPFDFDARLAR